MNISNLLSELKRRNVFRVVTAYSIAGWLIIQICDTTFPYLNFPDWIITAIIIIVIAGFPLAPIFAWVFEFTPDGIKKSGDVDITEAVTSSSSKKLNLIIIGILSLAIIFLVVERVFFAKDAFYEEMIESEAQTASVAVLPFADLSANGDQEYFSDGLSEELLNALAKVKEIKIAGRSSSFKFKGQNENLSLIGAELKVNHILEGSVRKSGNRIRITAQLINVSDGFNQWSETYDRELTTDNIFDIQEEISRTVLAQLKIILLPEADAILSNRPTQDIEAYNLYLEATQLEPNRKKEELEEAINKYKAAIRLDPTFAEAYARLAYAYHLLFNYGSLSEEELISLMKENIDQALLIDVNLGRAYHALAYYYRYTGEYNKSIEASERAVKLMPNDARSYVALRNGYFFTRQWDKVDYAMKKAFELDPNDPSIANMYARDLIGNGEVVEAVKILDKIIQQYPDFSPAVGQKARIYRDVSYGRIDLAFQLVYDQYMLDRNNVTNMIEVVNVSIDLGIPDLEDELIERIEREYPENEDIQSLKFSRNRSRGNFDAFWKNYDELIAKYGEEIRPNLEPIRIRLFFQQDKYDEALVILKKVLPELFLEPSTIDRSDMELAMISAVILRSMGENEQADKIVVSICERTEEFMNSIPEGENNTRAIEEQVTCDIARNEYDTAVRNIETFYFEKNSKANMLEYLNGSSENQALKKFPAYVDLKKRILADLGIIRGDVIKYLKEKGEWKAGNSK